MKMFQLAERLSLGRCARCAAVSAALICVLAGCGGESAPPTTVTVSGSLIDALAKVPLSGCTVKVQGTDLSATTDSSGSFAILNVPIGSQVLVVTNSLGNSEGTETVTISGAEGSTDALGTIDLATSGAPPGPPSRV